VPERTSEKSNFQVVPMIQFQGFFVFFFVKGKKKWGKDEEETDQI
jgi:hypothetical protein